jgi:signal transduction histidine kinase
VSTLPLHFLDGGGAMADIIRRRDWSDSPLGPPETWPGALKMAVGTCLSSRFPMVVWWGPDLLMLYNDAWIPILGESKHPAGLGRPGAESWPETWPIVGAQFEAALRGTANWSEDLLLASDRKGYIEECYFTYSHSPLRDASGDIVGVFTAVAETTARVLADRRRVKLHALSEAGAAAAREEATVGAACAKLIEAFCSGNPDAPFAALYLREATGHGLGLRADAGLDGLSVPVHIMCAGEPDDWGVLAAVTSAAPVEITLADQIGQLPGRPWPEPGRQVVAYPLVDRSSPLKVSGVLVCGVNARLRLDDAYRTFLQSAADRTAGIISNVRARRDERRRNEVTAKIVTLERRLFAARSAPRVMEVLLDAVLEAHGAERGNIQLYDPQSRALRIVVQRGFDEAFLTHFQTVSAGDGSACGRALADGTTLAVEDVDEDLEFAPHRAIAGSAGFRAVVSTPLLDSQTHDPVGMVSVHFAAPHQPRPDVVGLAEFYARLGSDVLVRRLAERRLEESEVRLTAANASLERRVAERTSELAAANRELLAEIGRRSEAEEAVRQMHRLDAVGQVTAGVAHDFNNLLSVVLGNAEFLLRDTSDPKQLRRLSMIQMAGERGAKLTGQLLAFSRLQRLEPKTLDINVVIQSIRELLVSTLGPGIPLQTALAADAWPALVDRTQLELVILNLVVNARQAMPDGGRLLLQTRNVTIRRPPERAGAPAPGHYSVIRISDCGPGMASDVLAKAFEPFFTTKAIGAGSGLGLAQAFGFATQSGGGVAIWSKVGRGTAVSLFLPRADGVDREDELLEAETAPDGLGRTVLVVDDEDDVRATGAEALRQLGYCILEAGSGGAALEILSQRRDVEALVLDYGMPGMTGAELARQVVAQWPRLPIVFLTGHAEHPGLAASPRQVIVQKPARPRDLANSIEVAITARAAS